MAIIQLILTAAILGFLYVRMLRREVPGPVGKKQAIIPVLLGVVSMPLSLIFTVGIGFLLLHLGYHTDSADPITVILHFVYNNDSVEPLAVRALISAFLGAGLTEELAKLLMMLLSFKLFRPKNLYEYILIGAAVGIGFTLLEEFSYGGDLLGFVRLITVALHMAFGMIMARHLGMARYYKLSAGGSVTREYVLAIAVPMLLHTLYDACTANNPALEAAGEGSELTTGIGIGLLVGLAAVLAGTVWQIVVLVRLKKNAESCCDIKLVPEDAGIGSEHLAVSHMEEGEREK